MISFFFFSNGFSFFTPKLTHYSIQISATPKKKIQRQKKIKWNYPTDWRRCLRRKTNMSHLCSLPHREHSSIYAKQTCQHCFATFCSSTYISSSERSEVADARWWNRPLVGESVVLAVAFPSQQGTLTMHIPNPVLVAAKSLLSSTLPARCNDLHLN